MLLRRENLSHKRSLSGKANSCNGIRLLKRPVSEIGRDWLRVRRTDVSRLPQWWSRAQIGYILFIPAVSYTVTVFRRSSIPGSSIRNHWALKKSGSRSRWPRCWAQFLHQAFIRDPWAWRRYVLRFGYWLGCRAFIHPLCSTPS